MLGYDDDGKIRDVIALQMKEPGVSRRQAILRIAGEGALRRIEMKMTSLEREGLLARTMRDAIADIHREACPARRFVRPARRLWRQGVDIFALVRPDGTQDLVGMSNDHLIAAGKQSAHTEELPYFVPIHWTTNIGRKEMTEAKDAHRLLLHYGLVVPVQGGVLGLTPSPIPVIEELAAALIARWEMFRGCIDGMTPADIRAEAVDRETARLDAAGISAVGAIFEKGLGRIISAACGWGENRFVRIAAECIESPERTAKLLEAGPFAEVLLDHMRDAAPEHGGRTIQSLLLDMKIELPVGGERLVCGADLDWLSATFADTSLAWIPERVIKLLVGYRTILQPDRMQHDEAKAALVTMANQLTSNYLADNGSVRFFYRLQEVSDSAISYDAVLDSLLHVSRGNLRDAIDAITKETDGLWMALMRHVLMPRLPKACYDDERVVTAIEEILRGCVVGDRTAAQIASAGLAWREAGRPAVCVWQTIPATGKEISRFFAWEAWERERESKPASTGGVEDFSAALEPFFVSGALKAGLAKLDAVIGEVQNEKVQAGFQPPMPPDSEMEGQPSLRRLTGLLAIIMATVALYFLKLSAH